MDSLPPSSPLKPTHRSGWAAWLLPQDAKRRLRTEQTAVAGLFSGVLLGAGIDVPPVEAHHGASRLTAEPGTPWASGVQLRVVASEETVAPWVAGRRITDDVVGVVTALLGDAPPLTREGGEPLRASDLAVLVRSNRRGAEVAAALGAVGVPATFSGTDSVFASPAAADWLALLLALDRGRRPFLQRAVLTDFVGGTVSDLALADDARWARWSEWLYAWGRTLRRSGVPALVAAIDRDRSEERRVGKECPSLCRSRWSPYH